MQDNPEIVILSEHYRCHFDHTLNGQIVVSGSPSVCWVGPASNRHQGACVRQSQQSAGEATWPMEVAT